MASQLGQVKHSRGIRAGQGDEHHDHSGSKKTASGSPGTIDRILPATNVNPEAIEKAQVLRVANTTASFQYLWSGSIEDAPTPVDATNGLALAPNSVEVLHMGRDKNLAIKTSALGVQVVATGQ